MPKLGAQVPAKELAMYALVLIGYVALGAGQAGVAGPPSQLIVGSYSSEKMCHDALKDFDRTASFRQVTTGMSDYRWGFICVPAGFGARG